MDKAKYSEIKNHINVNDLSDVVDYLHQQYGWSFHLSTIICGQYKNYLFLLAKYKKLIPPSYEIDQVHQAHMLTEPENYQELCKTIFGEKYNILSTYKPFFRRGRFILNKDAENFEIITKELFQKEFRQDIENHSYDSVWSWFGNKSYSFLEKALNRTFFSIFVPFAVVMYAGSVIHQNELVDNASYEIQNEAVKLSQEFENRAKLCKYKDIDKKNPNYLTQLFAVNSNLDNILDRLILIRRNAYQRQFITDLLNIQLGDFIKKYASLLEKYQPYICDAPHEFPQELIKERNDMLRKVQKSNNEMQEKLFGIFRIRSSHIAFTPEGPALFH